MKKLLHVLTLGVLSLAFCSSTPPVTGAAEGDPSKAAQKTAREMEYIVMQERDGRDRAFVVNTQCTVGTGCVSAVSDK